MITFLRLLNRDPDPAENQAGGGAEETAPEESIAGAIDDAIDDEGNLKEPEGGEEEEESGAGKKGEGEEEAGKDKEKAASGEEGLIEVDGKKIKDRRSRGYEGEKRRAADKAADDPEFDVDFDVEDNEGNKRTKLTLSELKEAAKFLQSNKKSIGASLKIREMATNNPEFGKLLNGIISKAHNENGEYNADFVSKTLSSLEAKADAVEDKIEDTDEDIKAAEDLLNSDEIDPDSVQAQVLKSNIKAMKATKAQLNKALSKIEEVSGKFEKVEQSHTTFLTDQQKAEETKEVERVSGIFNKEFSTITDPQRENAMKFVDEDDRKEFENKVRNIVAAESGKENTTIKTDADFVKLIRQASDTVYKRITSIRESAVNDYLRSKGQGPAKKGDDPKDTAVSVDDMKKQLAALEKDGKKDSPEAEKLKKAIKDEEAKQDDPLGGKTIGETIADAMYADT